MTKTVNINLAGYGFTIDEPAYFLLDEYLKAISDLCASDGETEMAIDIEQRISELLYERYDGGGIVTKHDIEEIIRRIGEPEEFMEGETIEKTAGGESAVDAMARNTVAVTPPPLKKRLFRDPRNKMLGGVCAGLAWYFGIDIVWVRLAFVGLCFLSLSTIAIVYLILWIVIPLARTSSEQLQMMGMESNVSNVGRVVTENYGVQEPTSSDSSGKQLATTLTEICGWVAKVLLWFVLGLAIIVSCSLVLGLGVVFVVCLISFFLSDDSFRHTTSLEEFRLTLGCVWSGTVVFGIPLILATRYFINVLSGNHKKMNKNLKRSLWIVWGVGAVITAVLCVLRLHYGI